MNLKKFAEVFEHSYIPSMNILCAFYQLFSYFIVHNARAKAFYDKYSNTFVRRKHHRIV